jgi:RHS repeat-associated protein
MPLRKSDLYSSLWASCDELRGGMDASQYKDYVLFMLFIKYITDKYGNSTDFAPPVTIPKGASFNDMLELRGKSDIGDKINTQVIAPLVQANARLARSGKKGADTTLFTWDSANRLKQAEYWTPGGAHTVVTFAYDAFGRRVVKIVNGVAERFVYDKDRVVEDIDASHNLIAEYGWAPGTDRLMYVRTPTTTSAAVLDPIVGSIRGLATAVLGTPVKQYAPPYWGKAPADTGFVLRYRLAGREYDQELGIYYNRARYYDPQLGRFLSEDPSGIAGGLNLYAYAGDDPINASDPFGICPPEGGLDCIDLPEFGTQVLYSDPACRGVTRGECVIKQMECQEGNNFWDFNTGSCYGLVGDPLGDPGENGSGTVGTTGNDMGPIQVPSCKDALTGVAVDVAFTAVGAKVGLSLAEGAATFAESASHEAAASYLYKAAASVANSGGAEDAAIIARASRGFAAADEAAAAARTTANASGAQISGAMVLSAKDVYDQAVNSGNPWWYRVMHALPGFGLGMSIGEAINGCILHLGE